MTRCRIAAVVQFIKVGGNYPSPFSDGIYKKVHR